MSCLFAGLLLAKIICMTYKKGGTFYRPPTYLRQLHRNSVECGGPSGDAGDLRGEGVLVNAALGSPHFAKLRQTSPDFAKLRMKARACFGSTLEPPRKHLGIFFGHTTDDWVILPSP